MAQKPRTLSVSRSEVKYLLSMPDRVYLLNALNRILIPDAYGTSGGYTVRSVYFDSMMNDDYLDKERHADEKKRLRVRVYHPDDRTAKFELKRKSFGRELKESVIISREDARRLLAGDCSALLHYDDETARYAYQLMTTRLYRPVSLIEYDRKAFTHPEFNTRVTMDNHLRCCEFCCDLFSKKLNFKALMPADETILEIKYDRFLLRQIQEVIAQCDLGKKAPSKFGSSRRILKHYYA